MLTGYSACIKTGNLHICNCAYTILFVCIQHTCILQDSRCLSSLLSSILTLKLGWFCCIQVWHSWRVDRDGPYIEARRSGVGEGRGGRPQQGYVDHSRYAMGVPNGRPRGRPLNEGEDYGLCEDLLGWCRLKHDYLIIALLTMNLYYLLVVHIGSSLQHGASLSDLPQGVCTIVYWKHEVSNSILVERAVVISRKFRKFSQDLLGELAL